MLEHLIQVVGEAHPLRSYLKLFFDITTGLPIVLAKKGHKSWQAEKYQHACLCFGLAMMYVVFLAGMALVLAPMFKTMMMAKLATSPATGVIVNMVCQGVMTGCKAAVRKVIGKIVTAIDRKFL
ncbi:TPA: hypothetical protein QCI71_002433 [Enterobacter chuandaensis]|uniref:Uncharacterized protein n=1 Tax=Enterobacter vonholyi TaxID=2797505 RepID=A0ABU6E8V2_9ENTR|nr:hypothetical protein [Enterobacter vonholyi]MEB6412240.1 hypothetical protein [Enterobacter vonholyi]HDR2621547.1 hypothetical protein [Enterobacter chuandaensis]HDT2108489.1 hypothetical protein [Enterobacter roggenkampii]